MSPPTSPLSSTRRRPVPPPKTESQAQLRQELTSPGLSQRAVSNQHERTDQAQDEASDPEAQRREVIKHLTLPPGWDLRNEVDVTYHTHVAKPVVHETIHQHTTELVEPRITREIHRYHQYDHIQPLEVEIPNDCYATNSKGEIIHAPGGLSTQTGRTSHWEQGRQDRGYSVPQTWPEGQVRDKTDMEDEGRDKIGGPFPIQAEGGGKRVLEGIRDGGIAQRFGGTLTSANASSRHHHTNIAGEPQTRAPEGGLDGTPPYQQQPPPQMPQTRPRGGGFAENSTEKQPYPNHAPQTPPTSDCFHSSQEDYALPDPTRRTNPNFAADLEQNFDRLSLQNHQSESKPLPSLPDTSPRSTHSKSGVRRMSGDNKLRERFSMDSHRPSLESQNPMIDDEAVPERGPSARKTGIHD